MSNKVGGKQPKGPIAWMVGNSVAANIIMVLCLVGGLMMALQVKQEVFPEFNMDTVTISVALPGAGPEEVEEGVLLPIEQAIQGLEGVKEVDATASEGSGTVSVEALEGADIVRLWQDIKGEIDQIDNFPDEAEEPSVSIESHQHEVISFILYGDQPERVLREKGEDIKDELLQSSDITQVELSGVRDYEIHIEISQENLRRYGLTMADVAEAVSNASVEQGGGSLKTSSGEILVRMDDRKRTGEEYARIPLLTLEDGSRILLEDVATVREGFEDSDMWASFNGNRAIMVDVYRVGSQTPGSVAGAAKKIIKNVEDNLPGGLHLEVRRDASVIFNQRAELLLSNAYMGLALVFVCLALFLEIRLAFWVSMGIPVSFLGSFLILSCMGFSINMITMFAFIVTLGIVVDDAIVVGENVYHHRSLGKGYLRAAVDGAREVAMPVIFSVVTNMVTFLPMLFIPGFMGKMFKFIPMVVISVFAISLFESLFILPAHIGHKPRGFKYHGFPFGIFRTLARFQERFSRGFEEFVRKAYGPFLRLTLEYRYTVVAVGVALFLIVTGYVASGRTGLVLFPKIESDFAYCEVELPYGSPTSRIKQVEEQLVQSAQRVIDASGGDKLSLGVSTDVDENTITSRIFLTDPEIRPVSTAEVTNRWRAATGSILGAESVSFESDHGGPGAGKGLSVRLSHRNIDQLKAAGKELAKRLEDFGGVSDIYDGSAQGKKQYSVHLLPAGERVGLTSQEVANQLRHAFYGYEAVKQQRGTNEVTVRVRLPEDERETESSLDNMVLKSPDGEEILLRNAARLEPSRAYTTIERTNSRRVVTVTANVHPESAAEQLAQELKVKVMPDIVAHHPGLSYSFEGKQADIRESTNSLFTGLLLSLLAIFALLAIPLRSYVQPLVIMFCIPFGIIGAILGHLALGYSMSINSLFGVVALTGVVVNDSLVLIDFANRRRREGMKAIDAIQDSGVQRFRPIMLTTLTTFGGLAPLIFETSLQARFLIPMAISLGFGILFATLITLVMVPSFYIILEDIMDLYRKPEDKQVDETHLKSSGVPKEPEQAIAHEPVVKHS